MPVGPFKRIKRDSSSTTVVELSITLAVALLLVMTGLRLMGGFGVDMHRASAQPTSQPAAPVEPTAEAVAVPAGLARTPRPIN